MVGTGCTSTTGASAASGLQRACERENGLGERSVLCPQRVMHADMTAGDQPEGITGPARPRDGPSAASQSGACRTSATISVGNPHGSRSAGRNTWIVPICKLPAAEPGDPLDRDQTASERLGDCHGARARSGVA